MPAERPEIAQTPEIQRLAPDLGPEDEPVEDVWDLNSSRRSLRLTKGYEAGAHK